MSNITGKEVVAVIDELMDKAKTCGHEIDYDSVDHLYFLRRKKPGERLVTADLENITLSAEVRRILEEVIDKSDWGKPIVRVTRGGDEDHLGTASISINSPQVIDKHRFPGFGLLADIKNTEIENPLVVFNLEGDMDQDDDPIFMALAETLKKWSDQTAICQDTIGMVSVAEMTLGLTEPPKRTRQ